MTGFTETPATLALKEWERAQTEGLDFHAKMEMASHYIFSYRDLKTVPSKGTLNFGHTLSFAASLVDWLGVDAADIVAVAALEAALEWGEHGTARMFSEVGGHIEDCMTMEEMDRKFEREDD